MSGLPFDAEIRLHDYLISQLCRELACSTRRERDLVAKLVGHIDRSRKQAHQLDKLRDEIHYLDEALRKARGDNPSLAEAL